MSGKSDSIEFSKSMHVALDELVSSLLTGTIDARALDQFLLETTDLPLKRIGEREREIKSLILTSRYHRERQNRRSSPNMHRFVVPWFDLFSGDGYRRERVLRTQKTGAPSPFLAAILFRRLNDWVPQVREAARDAIPKIVERTDASVVAAVLYALLPLRSSWKRLESEDNAVLDEVAAGATVASELARLIERSHSGPAVRVLLQASRRNTIDAHLSRISERATQPAVRALAYRMLLHNEAVWQSGWRWRWTDKSLGEKVKEPKLTSRPIHHDLGFSSVLQKAAVDPAAVVRRAAGDGLIRRIEELDEIDLHIARILAKDSYPSIAERGEFVLRKYDAI